MKTIYIDTFQYDELGPEAQEKARQWYREGWEQDDFWAECCIEDAKECGKIIGIDIDNIYYSGFWSQGDGACFTGSYSFVKGSVKNIREHAPEDTELLRIARELRDLRGRAWLNYSAKIEQGGNCYHKHCTSIEVFTEKRNGDEVETTKEAQSAVEELMWDFMDWIYARLEAEYNYQNSDECVAENIMANAYDFDAEGKRV